MIHKVQNLKKILLPVDFPHTSLRVIHQAAMWAHHFHCEIVMLHVLTAANHTAGVPEGPESAGWDLLEAIMVEAEKNLDQALGPELADLAIQRILVRGDVAQAIVQTAQQEKADLIMMPSNGHTFDQFLQDSVRVTLDGTDCPIWTDAPVEESSVQDLAIRNVLCAVNFDPHVHKAVSWAVQIADEFGAGLSLAHVTAGVEIWGPGGSLVDQTWKETLVSDASQQITELQQDMGIKANVFIGSGDVPTVLAQAAQQMKADLLVTGSRPYGVHLRTHGYAIMRAVPIPVLSV